MTAALGLALVGFPQQLTAQDFELNKLFTRPFVWGTTPSHPVWAKHSHVLAFLWNEKGGAFRDLYAYDADSKRLTRLTNLEQAKDPINISDDEQDPKIKNYLLPPPGLNSFDISEDGRRIAFGYKGDLYLVNTTSASSLLRLTKTKGGEGQPRFSPDGKKIAYTRTGQLFVQDLSNGVLEQMTDVKAPASLTGYRWSPDGKLFVFGVNPAPGRTLLLPNYSGQFVTAHPFPRDVAADDIRPAQLFVVESNGENLKELETGKGLAGARLGGLPEWSPDSKHLLVANVDSTLKKQEIALIDVPSGKLTTIFQNTDSRWIDASEVGWAPDSKHAWFTSDKDGYLHLYSASLDGKEVHQITKGAWEIRREPFSVSAPQWIGDYLYYSSTAAGASQRQFYRVKADGSAQPEQISRLPGLHMATVTEDGAMTAEMRADMKNPFDLYVNDVRVTHVTGQGFERLPWARTRFITYPSANDKKPVAARLLLPPDYNLDDPKQKQRPAVIYVHGSGTATSVLEQWGSYQELRFVFNNYLAQRGYLILEMDYRGSTGYGREWHRGIYLDMAGPDLDDVIGGVEYLKSLKNVDTTRLGIWGVSYGGFMTAAALFKTPDVFKAGAAFSGVYDWENYNAGYTQQRLTTPAENPEAYRRSSPIYFSGNLKNHLLIVHGIVDDNVLFQDAVQLSEKLIHEGKPFEEAFYPEENHGFTRDETLRDAFGRTAAFFERNLGPTH
jgi:dipeptidyl aminopeptidase/acylaminoacyl peptidase